MDAWCATFGGWRVNSSTWLAIKNERVNLERVEIVALSEHKGRWRASILMSSGGWYEYGLQGEELAAFAQTFGYELPPEMGGAE